MEQPQYHLQSVVHAKESLEDFDGPLDVILLLLSKNKIEIQDVSISSILEQYLAWLDERKRMDMEVASEFIAMASHLMYIKTRMLLSEAEKAEAESEMQELIASLQQRQRKDAYEQIKIAVQALALRNDIGLGMFPKTPEPLRRDQTYRYQHDRQDLLDALAAMQDRSQRKLPPPVSNFAGIVGAEPYPVAKKAAEVLRRLIGHVSWNVMQSSDAATKTTVCHTPSNCSCPSHARNASIEVPPGFTIQFILSQPMP